MPKLTKKVIDNSLSKKKDYVVWDIAFFTTL